MNDEIACCAHLNIVYAPVTCDGKNIRGEVVPNGAQYARWECQDCKSEFGPLSTLRTALARAEEQIKEVHCTYIDRWARVLDERSAAAVRQLAEKDKEIERLKAENSALAVDLRNAEWANTALEDEKQAAESRSRKLEQALGKLCDVLEAIDVHPSTWAVYTGAIAHGVVYAGPKYDEALAEARRVLEEGSQP